MVYLLENNTPAPTLHEKKVQLRNKTIHNGYFPTRNEAIEFCQSVLDIMSTIVEQLYTKYKEAMIEFNFCIKKELLKGIQEDTDIVYQSIPTAIRNFRTMNAETMDFDDLLKTRKEFSMFIK